MPRTYESAIGKLMISAPELYIDNKSRRRSGHMTHAMIELTPGKIMAFNSNCSAVRCNGHSAYGYVEYRCSEDYGRTWSDSRIVTPTYDALLDGLYTNSIEAAVMCNDVIVCLALRNNVIVPICCEPWDTPQIIRSLDGGQSWEAPVEFSQWHGRIYDAKVKDGVIYALQCCGDTFDAHKPEDRYRLFVSTDNGKTFTVRSEVAIPAMGHGYGALQFRPDGSLLAYACDIVDSYHLSVALSHDCGQSWQPLPDIMLKHGIRNVQICQLEDGYVMHGRAFQGAPWGKGQVVYASRDGLSWDDGVILEPDKTSCYYSNTLLLKEPGQPQKVLVQYSDCYEAARVNVMHLFLSVSKH